MPIGEGDAASAVVIAGRVIHQVSRDRWCGHHGIVDAVRVLIHDHPKIGRRWPRDIRQFTVR